MVEELRGVFLVWLLYMGTDLAHSIIGRLLRSYTTPPVPQPSYRDQRDPWWVNEAIQTIITWIHSEEDRRRE